jgi:hypothetical protein
MADENEARVYGMADQANRDPPAAQGTRGAKAALEPGARDPDLTHKVALGDGRTVTVSEGSGVAFAEATGRAGLTADAADDELSQGSAAPWLIGLALAAGIAIGVELRRRSLSERA